MKRPQDRNLEHLLATDLMQWTRGATGWIDRDGEAVRRFRPLEEREDALLVVRRMGELGFRFEDREVDEAADGGAVVVSFFRGSEVYSALAVGECQAICTAASRFVMHRAGESDASAVKPVEAEKVREE